MPVSLASFDRATLVAIGIGGVIGASARCAITSCNSSHAVDSVAAFDDFELVRSTSSIASATGIPADTLAVNLLGCLLLGALTLVLTNSHTPTNRRLLVGAATGLCGSLTTFSTFAVEIAALLRGPAQLATASAYLAFSVLGGAFVFWLGRMIAKRLVVFPVNATTGSAP